MNRIRFFQTAVLVASAWMLGSNAQALSVATDPVAAITYRFLGNSDTHISIPLQRPSVFEGTIESVDPVNNTITFAGEPGWLENELSSDEPHYVFLKNGIDEGMWLTITANSENTVTVSLGAADTLANIFGGESASVIPHWTPKSLFRDKATVMVDIHLFRDSIPGINQAPTCSLYYDIGTWYDLLNYGPVRDNLILYPSEAYVMRNYGETIYLTVTGSVPVASRRSVIQTRMANRTEDQKIAFVSPVKQVISNTGIPVEDGDVLWAVDDDWAAFNKAPTRVYEYYQGRWYDLIKPADVTDTLYLIPGEGYTLRKYKTETPEVKTWILAQPYID